MELKPINPRRFREENGLSLRQFAILAGVNHSSLHRLEKGKDITLSAYFKIINAMSVIKRAKAKGIDIKSVF